jgi:hypothetical protein
LSSADNTQGLEALDALIARFKRLGKMPQEVARLAAPAVEAACKKTAAAGTTPSGKPWPEKKGGGRALANAAEHVSAKAEGSSIVVTLRGKAEVVHNAGDHRNPQRQIIPRRGDGIPEHVQKAIFDLAKRVFLSEGGRG